MRVGAIIGLAGTEMSGANFEYSSAERTAAITMLESNFAWHPEKLNALRFLDYQAESAFTSDISKTRIEAAECCERAGLAWLSLVGPLPESRNKDILLAAKVMHFIGLGAGHLFKHITDCKIKGRDIDITICEKFLEMQVYTCWVCIEVGKYDVFADRNSLTDKINKIMLEQFGAGDTARSFIKAYNLSVQRECPDAVQQIFYNYALENIKHDFYNNDKTSSKFIILYKDELHKRLAAAIQSENKAEETKIGDELEKMSKRELELYALGHEVPNISNASKAPEPKSPGLRRRF